MLTKTWGGFQEKNPLDILASGTGLWLLIIPDRHNGTSLLVEEFRDNLWLRYNAFPPQHATNLQWLWYADDC